MQVLDYVCKEVVTNEEPRKRHSVYSRDHFLRDDIKNAILSEIEPYRSDQPYMEQIFRTLTDKSDSSQENEEQIKTTELVNAEPSNERLFENVTCKFEDQIKAFAQKLAQAYEKYEKDPALHPQFDVERKQYFEKFSRDSTSNTQKMFCIYFRNRLSKFKIDEFNSAAENFKSQLQKEIETANEPRRRDSEDDCLMIEIEPELIVIDENDTDEELQADHLIAVPPESPTSSNHQPENQISDHSTGIQSHKSIGSELTIEIHSFFSYKATEAVTNVAGIKRTSQITPSKTVEVPDQNYLHEVSEFETKLNADYKHYRNFPSSHPNYNEILKEYANQSEHTKEENCESFDGFFNRKLSQLYFADLFRGKKMLRENVNPEPQAKKPKSGSAINKDSRHGAIKMSEPSQDAIQDPESTDLDRMVFAILYAKKLIESGRNPTPQELHDILRKKSQQNTLGKFSY